MAEAISYNDLITNHRKEKKELMALTTKMKHSVSKGDKKKKKEMNNEIAEMMTSLELKHEEELKNFHDKESNDMAMAISQTSSVLQGSTNEPDSNLVTSTEETESTPDQDVLSNTVPKLSKAQKRRNRKAESAKEREKSIQEQEIINLSGNRMREMAVITQKLEERGLTIHEIPSDGNCLYNAIKHQLSTNHLKEISMKSLRKLTAEYIFSHKDEYIPFLTDPETGDIFSDEQFEKYCNEVMNTSAWGGHIEIQVLSIICGKPIEVIQALGSPIIAGNECDNPKLIISFHRHAFGLGAHYNSVVPT